MRHKNLAFFLLLVCACTDEPLPKATAPQTDNNSPEQTNSHNATAANNQTPNNDEPNTSSTNNQPVNVTTVENTTPNNTAPNVGQGVLKLPPRWVLRDRTGMARDVLVQPSYTNPTPGMLADFDQYQPQCFQILGTRNTPYQPARLYSLSTGSMEGCLPDSSATKFFSDADCTNGPYAPFLAAPTIALIDGVLVGAKGASVSGGPHQLYTLDAEGACRQSVSAPYIWKYEPVPSTMVAAFVDGAPYTLTWE